VASPVHKYVLDTNFFIQGFREPAANDALQEFHRSFAPFEYLSAIVAQELRSGTTSPRDLRDLERYVLMAFGRANRVIVPSMRSWHQSGDVLAKMARKDGLQVARVSKAFANDILLAVSCREAGCVLITDNERDFARIRRFTPFEFLGSWPGPAASRRQVS
jgi:predicted nucleic acid-binding protein